MQTIAVSTVGNIVNDGFSAITADSDVEFAGQALPGNIKLLEVMLKSDPENKILLTLCSQGYSSYALGYLEDSLAGPCARVLSPRARFRAPDPAAGQGCCEGAGRDGG